MQDVYVARVMSTDLRTVSPGTLVGEAAGLMLEADVGSVLVVDDGNHLEGILTSTDFVRIVSEREPKENTPVETYMTTDVVSVDAQSTVEEAADRMLEVGVHHLPVVDESEGLIGVVSTTDLTAYVSRAGAETRQ